MGTQKDRIVAVADEESVLHFTRRMLRREVQSLKYMPVVLNLRTLGNIISELAEDSDDFLTCDRYRMA